MTQEEINKCKQSFGYWYKNYFQPIDNNGKPIQKVELSKEQLDKIAKCNMLWDKVKTRYTINGQDAIRSLSSILEHLN